MIVDKMAVDKMVYRANLLKWYVMIDILPNDIF